ncbi:DNA polymerase Y family protein [Hoeflea sp. TYP-13]|uniref:DinB/UmuC family translesion DNA polymerase n=1 Tax=Hoeflea sp. TYP-13 TaxID=3230023 RepID=UPI0034C5E0D6
MSQRIMSIALPHLSTDRMARRKWGRSWRLNGRPDAPPLAAIAKVKNAMRLVAVDGCGHQAGLRVEQTLSDARALFPDLDVFDYDPQADAALLEAVAAWCDRYTPLVALERLPETVSGSCAGLYLDISGCAHLFGGEEAMLADVTSRLRVGGLMARAAIADTPGAAWAFARYSDRQVIEPGRHRQDLLDLPLAGLRLETEMLDMLRKLGLRTVGCIAALPRAPLAARFGNALLLRLDQALGREEEAISPRLPVPELSSERIFAEPIALQEDIERTAAQLAGNLRQRLDERQLGARRLELKLFRVDGHVATIAVRAASPVYHAERITMLFRERIAGFHEDLDAGFGFDLVRLNIVESEARQVEQADLGGSDGGNGRGEALCGLVDKLGARLGTDRVQRFVAADTHIPERSYGLVAQAAVGEAAATQAGFWREDGDVPESGGPVVLTRPVILFERPEQVEAVAEVPDGPPIRFRWRKTLYRITRSEGPERIACEWWRDGRGGHSRDYFRVEDEEGYRFWIFRQGLFERETRNPKWFMHGLFA